MTCAGAKEEETDGPTSLMMVGDEPLEVPERRESLLILSPLVSFGLRISSEAVGRKHKC